MAKKVAKKYKEFQAKDMAGRGHEGAVGFKKTQAYNGTAAPRVGGTIQSTGMALGGTKSQVKASKRRVNKSAASPQAKRSARRLY